MSGSFVSPGMRAKVRGLAEPVGRLFVRLGLSPNAITVIGFGIAFMVIAFTCHLSFFFVCMVMIAIGVVFLAKSRKSG